MARAPSRPIARPKIAGCAYENLARIVDKSGLSASADCNAERALNVIAETRAEADACVAFLRQPPRTAGIVMRSSLQARCVTSGQARNAKLLVRHMRTSLSRFLSHMTATSSRDRSGLAFTKASATSAAVAIFGCTNVRLASG